MVIAPTRGFGARMRAIGWLICGVTFGLGLFSPVSWAQADTGSGDTTTTVVICPLTTDPEPGGPGQGTPGGPASPGGPGQGTPGGPNNPQPTVVCQDGSISASPSVCTIDAATGVCASTITWNSTGGTVVRVKVFYHATGTTQVFSNTANGNVVAPWINAAGMRFDLQVDGEVIDSVEVVGNPPPVVSLAAPVAGAVFTTPFSTTLSTSASDADGISKVEFFDNGVLIGSPDTLAPYSVPWSSAALGSHTLTARATDARGATTTSAAAVVTVNAVKLSTTNKLVDSTVPAGSTASATFRLATAGKIRFQTSVGGLYVEQSPFDEWLEPESATVGAHFEVWALPVSGAVTSGPVNQWLSLGSATPRDWVLTRSLAGTSQAVVTIQIRQIGTTTVLASTNVTLRATVTAPPNAAPNINLTGPANNSVFTAPANIFMSANASDSDGTIGQVQFFSGGVALPGTTGNPNPDTTAAYSYAWNGVPAGTYTLTAKATDNGGAVTTSAPVNIIVNAPPSVTMPPLATQNAPCTWTLSATASDSDGTISQVQFFNGGVALPGTTGNPNPDTTAPYGYTWSAVAAGAYTLTAKATDNRGAVTTSQAVTATCAGPPTATLTAPANGSSTTRPDGPTLTATANTSAGTISKVEFFDNGVKLGEDLTAPYTYPSDGTTWNTANVAAGSHVLTVRATNSLGTVGPLSSPAVTITLLDPSPTVNFTAPAANSSHAEQSLVTLSANASITLGAISKVEFFDGTTPVGSPDTLAPYSVVWTASGIGSHTLKAKATSSWGTSATVSIPVNVTNPPPTITLTAPSEGASLPVAQEFILSASAADANGSVSNVEFFDGTTSLGISSSTGNPYTLPWTPSVTGNYTLTAKATDNLGAVTQSPTITVSVAEPAMCFVLPLPPGGAP